MKPTICLKIFSFSGDDIISTAVKFICTKIILELFTSVKTSGSGNKNPILE